MNVFGFLGFNGSLTTHGLPGFTGSTGATGATGAIGATGLLGIPGATGYSGLQGAIGAQGATGLPGLRGSSGLTGATGATGASGNTGGVGTKGPDGPTGAQGPPGNRKRRELISKLLFDGDTQDWKTTLKPSSRRRMRKSLEDEMLAVTNGHNNFNHNIYQHQRLQFNCGTTCALNFSMNLQTEINLLRNQLNVDRSLVEALGQVKNRALDCWFRLKQLYNAVTRQSTDGNDRLEIFCFVCEHCIASLVSVNSTLRVRGGGGGQHIWEVNLMHFLKFMFWVFFWGFGIMEGVGKFPPGDS